MALSYTEAINKGAVPSIESSWSYICKNECLKAVQDSYTIYEKVFFESFQQEVPMYEEELKHLYKEARTEAMKVFDSVAVGEVRVEFLKQIKEKMQQKYNYFAVENEKASEQECLRFLQFNYKAIEMKLQNQEYERLDELSRDIKEFMIYFQEEGPKGPNRSLYGQEFCYKALAEGSEFFFKRTSNELYLQASLAEQTQKKLK